MGKLITAITDDKKVTNNNTNTLNTNLATKYGIGTNSSSIITGNTVKNNGGATQYGPLATSTITLPSGNTATKNNETGQISIVAPTQSINKLTNAINAEKTLAQAYQDLISVGATPQNTTITTVKTPVTYSNSLLDPSGNNTFNTGTKTVATVNTKPTTTTTTPTIKNTGSTPTTTTTPTSSQIIYDDEPIYVGGGGGYYGGGSSSSNSDIYSLIQSMYDAQKAQAIADIQRAMEKAIASYQNSIDHLDENYQPLRNQSEVERYKSEQALKEQLANGGNMYSGMGRQDQLNLQNAYSNAITDINNQQQNELDSLSKAILDATQEGEYQKANAGYNYDIANYNAMINQYNTDRQYEWQKYLQQYQESQDALSNMYNYGGNTLSSVIPKVSSTSSSTSSNKNSATNSSWTTTKTKVNAAKTTGQVYDGVTDDIDTYYKQMGTYPLSTKAQNFLTQYKIDLGKINTSVSDDDIKTYIQAQRQAGKITDFDAIVLVKYLGL